MSHLHFKLYASTVVLRLVNSAESLGACDSRLKSLFAVPARNSVKIIQRIISLALNLSETAAVK